MSPSVQVSPGGSAVVMKYGFPSLANIKTRESYVTSYDPRTRTAAWVIERLNLATLRGQSDRKLCDFKEDDRWGNSRTGKNRILFIPSTLVPSLNPRDSHSTTAAVSIPPFPVYTCFTEPPMLTTRGVALTEVTWLLQPITSGVRKPWRTLSTSAMSRHR